jgi:hypothetical protein
MNDLISRQAAVDMLMERASTLRGSVGDLGGACSGAAKLIMQLPSAQPEIIHCRDCKHWQSEEYIGNNNVHTPNIASLPCKNWLTGGDWYCGSAERKDI